MNQGQFDEITKFLEQIALDTEALVRIASELNQAQEARQKRLEELEKAATLYFQPVKTRRSKPKKAI